MDNSLGNSTLVLTAVVIVVVDFAAAEVLFLAYRRKNVGKCYTQMHANKSIRWIFGRPPPQITQKNEAAQSY